MDRAQALTHLRSLCFYFYVESVPFTRAVIEGRTSLGGSESACLGLAQALAARGHDVHIFAAKLDLQPDDPHEYAGVSWHPAADLFEVMRFQAPDIFCSLRMSSPFGHTVPGALNLLWNQDMLVSISQVGSALPQIDYLVYVSHYHRQQWEGVDPKVLGQTPCFVTRNGFDPALVKAAIEGVEKVPYQFCHVSRPERGLTPLLAMWPEIRRRLPEATLHLCRYDSMYDVQGWGRICAQFDAQCQQVQAQVGGLVIHGNLNKPDLYRLIASSQLMLYPGVHDFAETGCLAAVEAQACGTPLIGSYRGALPETLGEGAGVLINGKAGTQEYTEVFLGTVISLTHAANAGDAEPASHALYVGMQAAGRAHVHPAYTFARLAAEWEEFLYTIFHQRYESRKIQVLRQLMYWDAHVAARLVAREIVGGHGYFGATQGTPAEEMQKASRAEHDWPVYNEALNAELLCDRVIAQQEQSPEQYAQSSLEPMVEISNTRFEAVINVFRAMHPPPRTLLDVACGNGSFAIAMCQAFPDLDVQAWDYSAGQIAKGLTAAQALGLASRITFHQGDWTQIHGTYDAIFCGEFLEHTEHPHLVIDRLEQHCRPGGQLAMTVPSGPFTSLMHYQQEPPHRGHTHAFSFRDLCVLLQQKREAFTEYLYSSPNWRNQPCGFFVIRWTPGGGPAVPLDYWRTVLTTRPYRRVVAGLIVKNEEEWITRCLRSLWGVVDDVVLLDTGSIDDTIRMAERFRNVHVHRMEWPDDFSVARNRCLQIATEEYAADWFFWIDADEHLVGGEQLHKYLQVEHNCFHGYVIRQQHLMFDSEDFFDVPVRIFRANHGIKFFGVVHEQPEDVINTGIFPSLDCPDVNIVHYGYEIEPVRRWKASTRNLALLIKELKGGGTHPTREMAWVLYIRDLVSLAGWQIGKTGLSPDQLPQDVRVRLATAIQVYRKHGFDNPEHRLHPLIWRYYQLALKWLGLGVETETAFQMAPTRTGLPRQHAKPVRFHAMTRAEAEAITLHKMQLTMKTLDPMVFEVMPWIEARAADVDVEPSPSQDIDQHVLPFKKQPAGSPQLARSFASDDTAELGAWLGHSDHSMEP